jgi:dephospho-CoA kinase
MEKPLQVGITGGIGSGKTLVCKIFEKLGIPVYDADSRAKMVMTTDGILIEQIKKEFGTLSYNLKGELNREYLSQAVFNQPEKLDKLNALVHPRVAVDYLQWLSRVQSAYCIKEAALLFEADTYRQLDKVVVVAAPDAIRIERVLKRDPHRTRTDVEAIMRNQMAQDEKIMRADYVIQNDESTLVIPQVLELHKRFSSMN